MTSPHAVFYQELLAHHPQTWIPQPFPFGDQVVDQVSNLAGCNPKPDGLSLADRAALALTNLQDHLEERAAGLLETAGGYPPQVDWRLYQGRNVLTPVKNQGFCSACTAFGTVAAVEALVRIQTGSDQMPTLSAGQLFFRTPGTQDCQTGWTIDEALEALKSPGVVPESLYPFDPGLSASALGPDWPSKTTAITGYTPVKSHRAMKKHLAEVGPLVTAMTFRKDFLYYGSGVYRPEFGAEMGGHCVCVVGYDDTEAAWTVRNSWGETWGESGYFRIAYGCCGIDSQMWAVDGLSRVYPNPTPTLR